MSPTIDTLPPEILALIASYVPLEWGNRLRHARNMSLVCRRFHDAVQPYMFEHIFIKQHESEPSADELKAWKHGEEKFQLWGRSINFKLGHYTSYPLPAPMLEPFNILESLELIEAENADPLPWEPYFHLLAVLTTTKPNLKTLRIERTRTGAPKPQDFNVARAALSSSDDNKVGAKLRTFHLHIKGRSPDLRYLHRVFGYHVYLLGDALKAVELLEIQYIYGIGQPDDLEDYEDGDDLEDDADLVQGTTADGDGEQILPQDLFEPGVGKKPWSFPKLINLEVKDSIWCMRFWDWFTDETKEHIKLLEWAWHAGERHSMGIEIEDVFAELAKFKNMEMLSIEEHQYPPPTGWYTPDAYPMGDMDPDDEWADWSEEISEKNQKLETLRVWVPGSYSPGKTYEIDREEDDPSEYVVQISSNEAF